MGGTETRRAATEQPRRGDSGGAADTARPVLFLVRDGTGGCETGCDVRKGRSQGGGPGSPEGPQAEKTTANEHREEVSTESTRQVLASQPTWFLPLTVLVTRQRDRKTTLLPRRQELKSQTSLRDTRGLKV